MAIIDNEVSKEPEMESPRKRWAKLFLKLRPRGMGLVVRISALPEVEEFMKGVGGGVKDPIEAYGRGWTPLHEHDLPLEIYKLTKVVHGMNNKIYSLGYPTRELFVEGEILNLAFLRLVGISVGNGISFVIAKEVYSREELFKLRDKLTKAISNFCLDFIMPHEAMGVIEASGNKGKKTNDPLYIPAPAQEAFINEAHDRVIPPPVNRVERNAREAARRAIREAANLRLAQERNLVNIQAQEDAIMNRARAPRGGDVPVFPQDAGNPRVEDLEARQARWRQEDEDRINGVPEDPNPF